MLLPAYYLSFLSLSLTRSPSQMSIFLENGLICCDASFPHYALTPKNPVNYAITPKIRLDYALRHYALHFPHYAITQKKLGQLRITQPKKGLLRHYANLYPPPLKSSMKSRAHYFHLSEAIKSTVPYEFFSAVTVSNIFSWRIQYTRSPFA